MNVNWKRYGIASLVVFAVSQGLDFFIHNILLMGSYVAQAHLWRTDMMQKAWLMWVTGLIVSFLFVYIFAKGYENKGLMEGVRFGLIIGLFTFIPMALGSYAVWPIPFTLAAKWFIAGMVEYPLLGLVAAAIYRPRAAAA